MLLTLLLMEFTAVMLSAETSVGKYPVDVINNMADILISVENSHLIEVYLKALLRFERKDLLLNQFATMLLNYQMI